MGPLLSTLVPEEKQARIQEVVQEAITFFSTSFANAYKVALINKIKEDAQPDEGGPEYQLIAPEAASWLLKAGILTKQSDVLKQWRARHCVARNAADNYCVDCYAGTDETGKQTATIHLCGYSAEEFDETDTKTHGSEFGFKLVPEDERRKTWMFKCSSAEERETWVTLLNANCVLAQPPISKDPIVQEAFMAAYTATRLHYGFYHNRPIVGTEDETLGSLVLDLVHREVLEGVLDGIPNAMAKGTVKTSIEKSVLGTVSTAWKSALAAAEPTKAQVESAAKASLTGIFEKEAEVKGKVTEAVGEKLDPFLASSGQKVFVPVCAALVAPTAACLRATVVGVRDALTALVATEGFTVEEAAGPNREEMCHGLSNDAAAWGGPVEEAAKQSALLTGGTSEAISKVAELFGAGFSLHALRNKIMQKNAQLAAYAVNTFVLGVAAADVAGKEAMAAGYSDVIATVLSKTIHDAKLYEGELVADIINSIVQPAVASDVLVPCASTAVAPIQAVIDALPGGLNEFFDVTSMMEDIIDDSLSNAIEAAVAPYKSEYEKTIGAPLPASPTPTPTAAA